MLLSRISVASSNETFAPSSLPTRPSNSFFILFFIRSGSFPQFLLDAPAPNGFHFAVRLAESFPQLVRRHRGKDARRADRIGGHPRLHYGLRRLALRRKCHDSEDERCRDQRAAQQAEAAAQDPIEERQTCEFEKFVNEIPDDGAQDHDPAKDHDKSQEVSEASRTEVRLQDPAHETVAPQPDYNRHDRGHQPDDLPRQALADPGEDGKRQDQHQYRIEPVHSSRPVRTLYA